MTLFPPLTTGTVRYRWAHRAAQRHRTAKRNHALDLKSQGAKLTDLGGSAWTAATEDYFAPAPLQGSLFSERQGA